MKLTEVRVNNYRTSVILNESWQQLTEAQQVYLGKWESQVWPLVEAYSRLLEADLSPEQIQKIFANAEEVAVSSGDNLTALGKAGKVTADVSTKITKQITKLMKQAQDSGPIKNVDQKFDNLLRQITTKLQGNKSGQTILSSVKKWRDFASENPAKSAFVIGAMTALLAFMSGGVLSGAAIGFFIRTTNNVLKGDKLSTSVAKGAQGAAIGAVAGGLASVISQYVPQDISYNIISSDGQSIDVSGLDAMNATQLDGLEPKAVEDLLKTQNSLETAVRSYDGENKDVLVSEFEKVTQKIEELGGADQLQDYAGLEGQDLERTKLSTSSGDVGTEVVEVPATTVSAEQLKAVGINFDAEPDISPEVVEWAQTNNIDTEKLQQLFQMTKGLQDAEFLGQSISAESYLETMSNSPDFSLVDVQLPSGDTVSVNQIVRSEVSTSIGGIEPPLFFSSQCAIEGVDGNGNPVFQITRVDIMETHPLWDSLDSIENLENRDEVLNQLNQYLNEYSGVSFDSRANVEEIVSNLRQNIANSIGASVTAIAVGGWLASKEVKSSKSNSEKNESRSYRGRLILDDEYLWDEFDLYEKTFSDTMKKIGSAVSKGVETGFQKGVQGVANVASSTGKELGNRITVKKLNRLWKRSGRPTDVESIIEILRNAGLADEQIGIIGKNTNVKDINNSLNQQGAPSLNAADVATGQDIPEPADQSASPGQSANDGNFGQDSATTSGQNQGGIRTLGSDEANAAINEIADAIIEQLNPKQIEAIIAYLVRISQSNT